MSPEKMVYMANQIATFFKSQPGDDRADRVAAHLNDFWDPRMRAQLLAHIEAGANGLDQIVIDASRKLRPAAAA